MRTRLLGLTAFVLVACGSNKDETPPTDLGGCSAGTISLSGTVDGTTLDDEWDVDSYELVQDQGPYHVKAGFGGDGELYLSWQTVLSEGQRTSSASGSLTPPSGAPHEGEKLCASGSFTRSVKGHSFSLGSLSTTPAGGACPGAGLDGDLGGCLNPPN